MNSPENRFLYAAAALVALLNPAATCIAQWSHNPAMNLGVSTAASDQNQPKILPTADGGCYMVWLDGIGTGWDTRVQRLDARGIKLWPGPPNGTLVADTAFSSTQDYGFALDTAGNAIVAYRDDGNVSGGGVHIKVQKVDPNGALVWPTPVQVTTVTGGNQPKVCGTSDGGAVVAWTASGTRVQKIDAAGNILWTAGGITDAPPAGSWSVCDVQASDNGAAIVLYVKSSVPRWLYAQKYDTSGNKMWNSGNALPIFDPAGNGLAIATFPPFLSDGAGGAIFAWNAGGGTRNSYVQRVSAAGTELFAHNGVAVADDIAGQIRVSGNVAFDPLSGDTYLIATETNAATQSMYRIVAQRVSSKGARLWGSTGVEVVPTSGSQPAFVQCQAVPGGGVAGSGGGMIAFFFDRPATMTSVQVAAIGLTSAGTFAWTPNSRPVCNATGTKSRLTSNRNAAGTSMFVAWSDARTDGGDIYAQNVNFNGSLGNGGDVNDDGTVDVNDLLLLVGSWGPCAPFCPADLTPPPIGDGQVDVNDLLLIIGAWD